MDHRADERHARPRVRGWYSRSASLMRWLHIYLSMVSFTALMFFALTGITLNHPSWLGAEQQVTIQARGQLERRWLEGSVDRLAIAEALRAGHALRGRVVEFEASEADCMIVFKSPGYSADVFVDRASGDYQVNVTSSNWLAVLNDLHKGRDAGSGWSLFIDASAGLMVLVSLSGFGLLLYLKRRRAAGLVAALIGTLAVIATWIIFVP